MDNYYIQHLMTYFRNLALNAVGVERDLYQLMQDGDVGRVIDMMLDNDVEVDKAIAEYNTQTHKIMKRPNKARTSGDDYVTEKLPRNRAQYINEIELFFLFGNPVVWKKVEGDDEAYKLFLDFLKDYHFNDRMREAKRLAGSELQSAKLYRIYREGTEKRVNVVVLSRSKGYRLRPLFDQYGNLVAFAYGYNLKENGQTVQHWDIQTADALYFCKRGKIGWDVQQYENPIGKISILYYEQKKAWDGVVPLIEREELLNSKEADNNNYFSDPVALATADVVGLLPRPEDAVGKLLQLTGQNSRFEYVNPPQSSDGRVSERQNLKDTILFDSFTPDLSFENMRNIAQLSGVAIKNALAIGYIKRANRIEIYGEMLKREVSVIKEVLKQLYPAKAAAIDALRIDYEFAEPFTNDIDARWGGIVNLFTNGLLSLEQAVEMLALTDDPEEEVERLKQAAKEAQEAAAAAKGGNAAPTQTNAVGSTGGTQ